MKELLAKSVVIGRDAFPDGRGSGNTVIGFNAGKDFIRGDDNVFVGADSARGVKFGSKNILIGETPTQQEEVSNTVFIGCEGMRIIIGGVDIVERNRQLETQVVALVKLINKERLYCL